MPYRVKTGAVAGKVEGEILDPNAIPTERADELVKRGVLEKVSERDAKEDAASDAEARSTENTKGQQHEIGKPANPKK